MPQLLALPLFYLGAPAVITNGLVGIGALGGILPGLVKLGVGLGLSALAQSLTRPERPKPEDVQTSLRIQYTHRTKHYGWMMAAGNWAFAEEENGNLHRVFTMGTCLLVSVASYHVDDKVISIDEDGWAVEAPYTNRVRLETRPGTDTQTHFAELTAIFPEWTEDHVGKGMTMLYARQKALKDDVVFKVFPKGVETQFRIVGQWSEVYNVTTEETEWSDDAALVIRDYMLSPDGARMPAAELSTPDAIEAWQLAHARSSRPRGKKAGGTEPWYRIWGSYSFGERPGDVLSRFLAACDARPIITRDGGLSIRIGSYTEDDVSDFVLDNSVITGFQSLRRGKDVLSTANVIRGTYLSTEHDWQATDAEPWIDEADVAARGEIASDRQFDHSPSHGQSRYLMKLEAHRANPDWSAMFFCRLPALQLFQVPLFPVDYWIGPVHIQGVFEPDEFAYIIGDKGVLEGVAITCHSMPLSAGSWNPATEEGDAPVAQQSTSDDVIPLATGLTVSLRRKAAAGAMIPYGLLAFDAPPSEALRVQARGRRDGDTDWQAIPVQDEQLTAESFALDDRETYQFQIGHVDPKGSIGEWGPFPPVELLAIADNVAPDAPVDLQASVLSGSVAFSARAAENDAATGATSVLIFKRGSTGQTFAAATQIKRLAAKPNDVRSYTEAPGAGKYKYWADAENRSGVHSASPASIDVTVPGIAFSDNFNRADGGLGASWTEFGAAGSASITSNVVSFAATTGAYAAPAMNTPDHYAQVTFIHTTSRVFFPLAIRIIDQNNYIGLRYNTQWQVIEVVAGIFTTRGTLATPPNATGSNILRMQAVGSTLTVTIDGTPVTISSPMSGSLAAATRAGFVARAVAGTSVIDNFECGVP